MALRELIAKFTVDTGDIKSKMGAMSEALNGAKEKLIGLAEAFGESALVEGFREMISSAVELGASLKDTSDRLGVTTDELQRFQYYAKLSGSNSEEAANGLKFLNKNLGDIQLGVAGANTPFKQLHVNVKNADGSLRSVTDLIPDLADGFAQLKTPQERTALAMQVFGRAGAAMIPILKDGRGGIAELNKEFDALGGGISENFIDKAKEVDDQLARMKFGLTVFKTEIVLGALPALQHFYQRATQVVGYLIQFARKTNLAKEAVTILGTASAAAAIKAAVGVAKLTGLIKKGAGLFESLLSLGYIGLAIAAIALLYLVFEDLFGFINGEQSVIGDLITQFMGADKAAEVAKELRDAWDEIKKALEPVVPILEDAAKWLLSVGIDALPLIVKGFVLWAETLAITVKLVAQLIEGLGKLSSWSPTKDVLDSTGLSDKLAAFGQNHGLRVATAGQDKNIKNGYADTPYDIPNKPSIPASAAGGGAGTTVHNKNEINVSVQGGSTNAQTGSVVAGAITDALSQKDLDAYFAGIPGTQ